LKFSKTFSPSLLPISNVCYFSFWHCPKKEQIPIMVFVNFSHKNVTKPISGLVHLKPIDPRQPKFPAIASAPKSRPFWAPATAGPASGQGPRAVWIVGFVFPFGDSNGQEISEIFSFNIQSFNQVNHGSDREWIGIETPKIVCLTVFIPAP
jgi:hypothetical protein